ncbi:hypothetical protein [Actinosynnema sp. NPDC023587]|uniref:hypothetical protein n=1 Tax=Actinosynnema sp. NPDC023587 TaxID=3154695 RepID=UPI0033EAFF92
MEIEKWLSTSHDEYAELSMAAHFATLCTIMNAAVRAKVAPANPCYGIRVTAGEFENELLVASPVQALRAAMHLYESEMGSQGSRCAWSAATPMGGRASYSRRSTPNIP